METIIEDDEQLKELRYLMRCVDDFIQKWSSDESITQDIVRIANELRHIEKEILYGN